MALGEGGLMVTYGGLAVGGNVIGGSGNGQFALQPKGTRGEFAYLVGASYAFGQFIVGAHYLDYMSAGNRSATASPWVGNLNQWGVAAGATYALAPGVNLYLSYLYGHRKEQGVDLLSGVNSSGSSFSGRVLTHNNVQAQGISVGTQLRW